ncbi:MAG: DUF6504 family protein [Candidatus Zipacnadales bacterium]
MRRQRFFGQRIEVRCQHDESGLYVPQQFVFGEEVLRITEILRQWHDSGFNATSRRRTWLERRHRTYYRVHTHDGSLCDLYVDRTGNRRDWFLTRRLSLESSTEKSGQE